MVHVTIYQAALLQHLTLSQSASPAPTAHLLRAELEDLEQFANAGRVAVCSLVDYRLVRLGRESNPDRLSLRGAGPAGAAGSRHQRLLGAETWVTAPGTRNLKQLSVL